MCITPYYMKNLDQKYLSRPRVFEVKLSQRNLHKLSPEVYRRIIGRCWQCDADLQVHKEVFRVCRIRAHMHEQHRKIRIVRCGVCRSQAFELADFPTQAENREEKLIGTGPQRECPNPVDRQSLVR